MSATSGPAGAVEFAPAKVNLALHVTGRRSDGYHVLDSLVCFPRVGDTLTAEPAVGLSLETGGPFGASLAEEGDNLVLRAARLLAGGGRGARLTLRKCLPVASGIGGGSADAAAALRLLARVWAVSLPAPEALTPLGADVPVCLSSRPARMRGIGERLDPLALPRFWLVLVNPGRPVPTAGVFARLDCRDNPALPEPPGFGNAADLADWLASATRNDLQEAASSLEPGVRDALAVLERLPGCRLARMSGSGATCFGLFGTAREAREGAQATSRARPAWWVSAAESRPEGLLPGGPAGA